MDKEQFVKVEGKLPEFFNGVEPLLADLLDDPREMRIAIVHFKVSKIVRDTFADTESPTIKIMRIEPVFGEVKDVVEQYSLTTYDKRVGIDSLPTDLEREVKDGLLTVPDAVKHDGKGNVIEVTFSHVREGQDA